MSSRIATIVGARPQFVKAAVTSLAFRAEGFDEVIIHTGQHYDPSMSDVFFTEMALPQEDHNLGVGSGSHAETTSRALERLEPVLLEIEPEAAVVFGDTDSTLAGALAAAKVHIPVAHVEAGMRSFNRRMPEELNRVLTDHTATWHYCSTESAARNLAAEGVTAGVEVVGDVMADAVARFGDRETSVFPPGRVAELGLSAGRYVVLTCHRAENVDDPKRLRGVLEGAARVCRELPVIFPVHPRARDALAEHSPPPSLHLVEPFSYLEMLALLREAAAVMTDSGGLQKEAYLLRRPCVTLRDETEWVETISLGWNVLSGTDPEKIEASLRSALELPLPPWRRDLFGDGHAATRIARHLRRSLTS